MGSNIAEKTGSTDVESGNNSPSKTSASKVRGLLENNKDDTNAQFESLINTGGPLDGSTEELDLPRNLRKNGQSSSLSGAFDQAKADLAESSQPEKPPAKPTRREITPEEAASLPKYTAEEANALSQKFGPDWWKLDPSLTGHPIVSPAKGTPDQFGEHQARMAEPKLPDTEEIRRQRQIDQGDNASTVARTKLQPPPPGAPDQYGAYQDERNIPSLPNPEERRQQRAAEAEARGEGPIKALTAEDVENQEARDELTNDYDSWRDFANNKGGLGNVPLSEFAKSEGINGVNEEQKRVDEIMDTTAESFIDARLTPDDPILRDMATAFTDADRDAINERFINKLREFSFTKDLTASEKEYVEKWRTFFNENEQIGVSLNLGERDNGGMSRNQAEAAINKDADLYNAKQAKLHQDYLDHVDRQRAKGEPIFPPGDEYTGFPADLEGRTKRALEKGVDVLNKMATKRFFGVTALEAMAMAGGIARIGSLALISAERKGILKTAEAMALGAAVGAGKSLGEDYRDRLGAAGSEKTLVERRLSAVSKGFESTGSLDEAIEKGNVNDETLAKIEAARKLSLWQKIKEIPKIRINRKKLALNIAKGALFGAAAEGFLSLFESGNTDMTNTDEMASGNPMGESFDDRRMPLGEPALYPDNNPASEQATGNPTGEFFDDRRMPSGNPYPENTPPEVFTDPRKGISGPDYQTPFPYGNSTETTIDPRTGLSVPDGNNYQTETPIPYGDSKTVITDPREGLYVPDVDNPNRVSPIPYGNSKETILDPRQGLSSPEPYAETTIDPRTGLRGPIETITDPRQSLGTPYAETTIDPRTGLPTEVIPPVEALRNNFFDQIIHIDGNDPIQDTVWNSISFPDGFFHGTDNGWVNPDNGVTQRQVIQDMVSDFLRSHGLNPDSVQAGQTFPPLREILTQEEMNIIQRAMETNSMNEFRPIYDEYNGRG